MLPTDGDLRRTITQGLSGTAMGMFSGLEATDLRAVIEYVKFFSRRWRHPENHAEAIVFPEPPQWLESASERGPHIAEGKMLFSTLCVSCHGPDADGNRPAATMLKDVWGQPSAPSSLRQAHLRCGDCTADIYRVDVRVILPVPEEEPRRLRWPRGAPATVRASRSSLRPLDAEDWHGSHSTFRSWPGFYGQWPTFPRPGST
jgi:cytochrome c2